MLGKTPLRPACEPAGKARGRARNGCARPKEEGTAPTGSGGRRPEAELRPPGLALSWLRPPDALGGLPGFLMQRDVCFTVKGFQLPGAGGGPPSSPRRPGPPLPEPPLQIRLRESWVPPHYPI